MKVSADGVNPTVVLARKTAGTIAKVAVQSDNSLVVTATDDVNGSGEIADNDDENEENEVEDQDGTVIATPTATATPTSTPIATPTPTPTPTVPPR